MIKKAPVLLLLILLIPFAYSGLTYPNADIWCYESGGLCYDLYGGASCTGMIAQSRASNKNAENFNAFDISAEASCHSAFLYYYTTLVFNVNPDVDIEIYLCTDGTFDETTISWANRDTQVDSGSCTLVDSIPTDTYTAETWYMQNITDYIGGDDTFTIKMVTNPTDFSTSPIGIYIGEYECNNGIGAYINCTAAPMPPLSINHISPINNTINNTNLQVYYETTLKSNCTLNINGTANTTMLNNNANTSVYFNISLETQGTYIYNINCSESQYAQTDYTENRTYFYDPNAPFISWIFPLNDNSSLVAYEGDANINLSGSDDNLYVGNFTVYKPDDSIYYNDQTININTTTWAYNLTILNITDSGEWDIRAQFWDSHTTKEFKVRDIIINKEKQEWTFITNKDDTISLSIVESSIKNNVVSIYSEWQYDRYTFGISADKNIKKGDYIIFNIDTDKPLKYLHNSEYIGHFIIGFDYWIDFEGITNTEVTYLGNNQVRVLFNDKVDKDKIEFKSIGGLNYNEEWAHFTVLSPPAPPSNGSVSCDECLNSTINCTVIYTVNSSGWLQQQMFCENYLNSTVQLYGITREVNKTMILAILILLPIIAGFALLYGASQMGEAHTPLKIFMYLLTPIMFWASMHIGLVSVIYYFNFPIMQETLATYTQITGWIFGILIAYWAIYFIYVAFQAHEEKKKERLEY